MKSILILRIKFLSNFLHNPFCSKQEFPNFPFTKTFLLTRYKFYKRIGKSKMFNKFFIVVQVTQFHNSCYSFITFHIKKKWIERKEVHFISVYSIFGNANRIFNFSFQQKDTKIGTRKKFYKSSSNTIFNF